MNSTQSFDTCEDIKNDWFLPGFNLSTPKASGSPEQATINLDYLETPEEGSSYYFVIKAVDEYDNMGAESNLAKIQGPVPPDDSTNVGLIVGLTLGITALVCVVVGGVFFTYRSKKKSYMV